MLLVIIIVIILIIGLTCLCMKGCDSQNPNMGRIEARRRGVGS